METNVKLLYKTLMLHVADVIYFLSFNIQRKSNYKLDKTFYFFHLKVVLHPVNHSYFYIQTSTVSSGGGRSRNMLISNHYRHLYLENHP